MSAASQKSPPASSVLSSRRHFARTPKGWQEREHPLQAEARTPVLIRLMPAAGPGLLLYLSLGLVRGCRLLFQSLLRALIRFRSGNISSRGFGVGSLRQAARPLLLPQF